MPKYSTSILINASQETVWKILSNVAHWHEWTPTVSKVEVVDQLALKLGNRYKVYQPKLQPAVWIVTTFVPPSSFVWEANLPGMHMVAEHMLKQVSADQTQLTLTFTFKGWLGRIMGNLYRSTVESYIAIEAQSLKKRVEVG